MAQRAVVAQCPVAEPIKIEMRWPRVRQHRDRFSPRISQNERFARVPVRRILAWRAELQFATDLSTGKIYVIVKDAVVEIEVPEFGKRTVDFTGEVAVV